VHFQEIHKNHHGMTERQMFFKNTGKKWGVELGPEIIVFCSGHNAHTLDKGSYRRTRSVVLYRCGIRYDPQSGFPGNLYREGTSYPIYIDVLENCVC
jgi:hypothetical protein